MAKPKITVRGNQVTIEDPFMLQFLTGVSALSKVPVEGVLNGLIAAQLFRIEHQERPKKKKKGGRRD